MYWVKSVHGNYASNLEMFWKLHIFSIVVKCSGRRQTHMTANQTSFNAEQFILRWLCYSH